MLYDVKKCICGHNEYAHFTPQSNSTKKICRYNSCKCRQYQEEEE